MVKVRFSSALQGVTKTTLKEVPVEGTLHDLFAHLKKEFGAEFENRLFEAGKLRRFVNVFVNGEDVRHLQGLETPVKAGDEVSILPAVSGG
ncbi:MAG: MoaD family protein [Euryarchaeota archaeon]|nr:MoaD family protein [Euryarchaeota archaeon]